MEKKIMLIRYNKFEDYLEKIKTLSKDVDVYVSLNRNVTETGMVSPNITIQVMTEDDCYMFTYYEDLPTFKIISGLTDKKLVEMYNEQYGSFQKTLDDEYNKMLKILKEDYKFKNIENAIVQG